MKGSPLKSPGESASELYHSQRWETVRALTWTGGKVRIVLESCRVSTIGVASVGM